MRLALKGPRHPRLLTQSEDFEQAEVTIASQMPPVPHEAPCCRILMVLLLRAVTAVGVVAAVYDRAGFSLREAVSRALDAASHKH